MRKTFPATERLAVSADLGAGVITVAADDVTDVVVEVDGPRADEFDVRLEGDRLSVRPPRTRFFGNGDDHEVRLAVPTGSDLSTRTGSADLRVDGSVGLSPEWIDEPDHGLLYTTPGDDRGIWFTPLP